MPTTAITAPKAKPTPETIRQSVLADQATARAEVAAARTKTPTKTAKVKATKANKANTKPAKADSRTITVLAKTNPHAAGSRRAGWFKQLKTGMTVDGAVTAGVRSIYLQRMAARNVIKIG